MYLYTNFDINTSHDDLALLIRHQGDMNLRKSSKGEIIVSSHALLDQTKLRLEPKKLNSDVLLAGLC